jgi:uncharacterized protein (DUF433 family)
LAEREGLTRAFGPRPLASLTLGAP